METQALEESAVAHGDAVGAWITPAVALAHQVLMNDVPAAAFGGEPFMHTVPIELPRRNMLACCCFYHSVLFFENSGKIKAAVFTRDEGGMVPWYRGIPDPLYLDQIFELPSGNFADLWTSTMAALGLPCDTTQKSAACV